MSKFVYMERGFCLLMLFQVFMACSDNASDLVLEIPEGTGEKNEGAVESGNAKKLPLVLIDTPDGIGITSKDEYVEGARISVSSDDESYSFSDTVKVKGRGNSTWTENKKPYALKFDEKKELLKYPKSKSWVLLANAYDTTLIRNDIAFFMGREMSRLDYTPRFEFVDLTLNNEYLGVYQLGEKVKVEEGRVDIGKDGFLIEIDANARPDEITFTTERILWPINIKEPDVVVGDDDYNYVKEYLEAAEKALFSDSFKDERVGYVKYLDVESFVEWYLVNEIAGNCDAIYYSSCYMNLKRGGKLKMGPLWDFDIAFGNSLWNPRPNDPRQFWIRDNTTWYNRLFSDPAFVVKVTARFNEYYADRQKIYDRIELDYERLVDKVVAENALWGRICDRSSTEDEVRAAYRERVDYLTAWLKVRLEWLNENLNRSVYQ